MISFSTFYSSARYFFYKRTQNAFVLFKEAFSIIPSLTLSNLYLCILNIEWGITKVQHLSLSPSYKFTRKFTIEQLNLISGSLLGIIDFS